MRIYENWHSCLMVKQNLSTPSTNTAPNQTLPSFRPFSIPLHKISPQLLIYNNNGIHPQMSTKKHPLNDSSILTTNLNKYQNKQNLNCDELHQMVTLLRAYEALCIQREDFAGAESVKNKIEHLLGQELVNKREKIAVREKEQIQVICREGDEEIKRFQQTWDVEIQALIEELKTTEQEMTLTQKRQMEEFEARLKDQVAPKVKYSSHVLEKRNYLANLIKARNYREAEAVKYSLRELETTQGVRWVQKFEEKKQLRVQKLQKRQAGELQALRVKLEAAFNEKIKERDRKFEILLKKNRKRRVDSTKPSRERIRSRHGILTESKFNSNVSFV